MKLQTWESLHIAADIDDSIYAQLLASPFPSDLLAEIRRAALLPHVDYAGQFGNLEIARMCGKAGSPENSAAIYPVIRIGIRRGSQVLVEDQLEVTVQETQVQVQEGQLKLREIPLMRIRAGQDVRNAAVQICLASGAITGASHEFPEDRPGDWRPVSCSLELRDGAVIIEYQEFQHSALLLAWSIVRLVEILDTLWASETG